MLNLNHAAATSAMTEIRRNLRTLGTALPADLAADLDRLETISSEAGDVARPDLGAMGVAALDAVLAGNDPMTDETVVRELLRAHAQASNIGEAIRSAAHNRRAALVPKYGPAILDLLRPVVAAADETLAEARRVIGSTELHHDTPTAVVGWPAEKLSAWAHARDALARLDAVGKVWRALATLGLAQVEHDQTPLIMADLTHSELSALPSKGGRRDPVAAALAGHPLALADFNTYRDRAARVRKEGAAEEARRLAEQTDRKRPVAMRVGRL